MNQQTDQITVEMLEQAERYWMSKLTVPLPDTCLPCPSTLNGYLARTINFELPDKLSGKLLTIANNNDLSLYILLVALYEVLLSRFGKPSQNDFGFRQSNVLVLCPTPSSLTGAFQTYIPLQNVIVENLTFKEFLLGLRDLFVEGHQHAILEIDDLSEIVGAAESGPLFRHVIFSRNLHDCDEDVKKIERHDKQIILFVERVESRISLALKYNSLAYPEPTARKLLNCYQFLASQVAENAAQRISDLRLVDHEEENRIRSFSAGRVMTDEQQSTVVELFETQAHVSGNSEAVGSLLQLDNIYNELSPKFLKESITYSALNGRANQIARGLRDHGVGPEHVVGILIDHPLRKVEAILGVLKAGAAYLPINSSFPDKLKQYILRESSVKILLTEQGLQKSIPISLQPEVVLDVESSTFNAQPTSNLGLRRDPQNACYVCFTSGTTSRLKGVVIEHRGLFNYTSWRLQTLNFTSTDITLQLVPFSSDGFCSNLFPTLCAGGTVVMIPESRHNDASYICNVIERFDITNMSLVPSMYSHVLDELKEQHLRKLRLLVLAGEPVPADLVQRTKSLNPYITIANEYGPTETTVAATLHVGTDAENTQVIGRPIFNTSVMILNQNLELTPIDVPGEIYISGPGVARGYLNDPELTKERFIANPLSEGGPMAYRSGDLGSWCSDGTLKHLGRLDQQRKLRGNRIDLAYLEWKIRDVVEANDLFLELKKPTGISGNSDSSHQCLVAYIVSPHKISASEIKRQLHDELPDYMVPDLVFKLDHLPRTAEYEIDVNALSDAISLGTAQFTSPQTETEVSVARLFERVLRLESGSVGRASNFFELGGHSLKVTQLVALIHSDFRVNLRISEIYDAPTVDSIAKLIDGHEKNTAETLLPVEEKYYYALSPAQESMYVMRYSGSNSTAYNTPVLINWGERIDAQRLERACRMLIKQHEGFRTSFVTVGQNVWQTIKDDVPFSLEQLSVSSDQAQLALDDFVRPFALDTAPILRVCLVRIDDEQDLIALDSHHIVADGESMEITLSDLHAFYNGATPTAMTLQYKDYAEWRAKRWQNGKLKDVENFWLKKFADGVPRLTLPTDYDRPKLLPTTGAYLVEMLDADVCSRVERITNKNRTTTSTFLFSAFALLLAKFTLQKDLVIGLSVSGRTQPGLDRVVGNFASSVPLRCYVDFQNTFRHFLINNKYGIIDAYENQEFSLDRLVQRLAIRRESNRNPIFDVEFQFTDGRDGISSSSNLTFEPTSTITVEGGLTLSFHRNPVFDLVLLATQYKDAIRLELGFNSSLWRESTARLILSELINIIDLVSSDENITLSDIKMHDLASRTAAIVATADAQGHGFRF